jgi:hypothetical protein
MKIGFYTKFVQTYKTWEICDGGPYVSSTCIMNKPQITFSNL